MKYLATALIVHQAWWEDNDSWDGASLYLDEETAKTHAALDYTGYEYCCRGECGNEGTDDHASIPALTWVKEHGSWHLLADGTATGIQVSTTHIYRPATPYEVKQRNALHAVEKAERAHAQGAANKTFTEQLEELFNGRRSTS